MARTSTDRTSLRLLAVGGFAFAGLVSVAGCGSDGGEARVTLPPGLSAGAGTVTLPDDVDISRPPDAESTEAPAAAPPTAPPTEAPSEAPGGEAPATEAPADDAGEAVEAAANDEGTVWWPWLLGLLLVAAAVAAVVAARSRRGTSAWTSRALAAIDASDALTTHLLAMAPEGLVVVARDDARRLAELDATMQDLVRDAPDDRTRSSIDGLRGPLTQLHAAVDMVSLSPTADPTQVGLVRQWATALHVATSTARASFRPTPG